MKNIYLLVKALAVSVSFFGAGAVTTALRSSDKINSMCDGLLKKAKRIRTNKRQQA
jgi:hypothetical protein